MNPANNPPVTAATIAGAINALILAWTDLGAEKDAAIVLAVTVLAGVIASRFTTPVSNLRDHG